MPIVPIRRPNGELFTLSGNRLSLNPLSALTTPGRLTDPPEGDAGDPDD
jgi:hypothetical protein